LFAEIVAHLQTFSSSSQLVDIWPTETAPVLRRREHGVELVQLRWGFPPARPKGASESPKSKWKFTHAGEDWFCFAGRGDRCPTVPAAPLRCSPPSLGPTSRPSSIGRWSYWTAPTGSPGSISPVPKPKLLRPLRAGSVDVEQVR
jgi:hypothetical protein